MNNECKIEMIRSTPQVPEFSRVSVDALPMTWWDKANIGLSMYFMPLTSGECGVINE